MGGEFSVRPSARGGGDEKKIGEKYDEKETIMFEKMHIFYPIVIKYAYFSPD